MQKKLFDFDKEFRLGIDAVDNEHVKLVDMLNEVHFLLSDGKRDEARKYFNITLSAYVDEHFANEERFMESFEFPMLEEHRKIHNNFRKSFEELKPQIELLDEDAFRQALSETFAWILSHIGKTDKRYVKYYFSKGS